MLGDGRSDFTDNAAYTSLVPGFVKQDYRDEDEFWQQVERSRELAVGVVERIRSGDVRHDPKEGDCPTWCALWPMCRVRRA